MFQRIAVIDLGTNTFNLLVVEINPYKEIEILFETKLAVKLGEGGINKKFIQPLPFQRGISSLKIHHQSIEKFKVQKIFAFGTSALREASNAQDFIDKVKEETNITIELISGDREAELIYLGVRKAVEMYNETSLIIDIGGGSTEFILANKNTILWKQSFQLGASRLLQMFNPSDPITDDEMNTLTAHFSEELKSFDEAIRKLPVVELIGSSGSFDSLAEMIAHKFYTPKILERLTEFDFKMSDCEAIYHMVIKSTRAQRLQMKGLAKMRVDNFVISSLLVHYVVTKYKINKMRLSTYSLKEGVVAELLIPKP